MAADQNENRPHRTRHSGRDINYAEDNEELDKTIGFSPENSVYQKALNIKLLRRKLEYKHAASSLTPEIDHVANLTNKILREGFRRPYFVPSHASGNIESTRRHLGLCIPSPQLFTPRSIAAAVGKDTIVPTFDVNTQDTGPRMTIEKLADYFDTPPPNRTKLINVVSFNLSGTSIEDLITPPKAVIHLDLVSSVWPQDTSHDKDPASLAPRPQTLVYALFGPAGAYTDWHVDMGGSSVWYHVIKGCKIFMVAPRTPKNQSLFENWSTSPAQTSEFLGDSLEKCIRIVLKAGDTLFLPSGWPHAVSTPEDSIVVGGNFLHKLNFESLLEVSEREERLDVADRFRYPCFKKLMFYSAQYFVDAVQRAQRDDSIPSSVSFLSQWELQGLPYLYQLLKHWILGDSSADNPRNLKNIRRRRRKKISAKDIPDSIEDPILFLEIFQHCIDQLSLGNVMAITASNCDDDGSFDILDNGSNPAHHGDNPLSFLNDIDSVSNIPFMDHLSDVIDYDVVSAKDSYKGGYICESHATKEDHMHALMGHRNTAAATTSFGNGGGVMVMVPLEERIKAGYEYRGDDGSYRREEYSSSDEDDDAEDCSDDDDDDLHIEKRKRKDGPRRAKQMTALERLKAARQKARDKSQGRYLGGDGGGVSGHRCGPGDSSRSSDDDNGNGNGNGNDGHRLVHMEKKRKHQDVKKKVQPLSDKHSPRKKPGLTAKMIAAQLKHESLQKVAQTAVPLGRSASRAVRQAHKDKPITTTTTTITTATTTTTITNTGQGNQSIIHRQIVPSPGLEPSRSIAMPTAASPVVDKELHANTGTDISLAVKKEQEQQQEEALNIQKKSENEHAKAMKAIDKVNQLRQILQREERFLGKVLSGAVKLHDNGKKIEESINQHKKILENQEKVLKGCIFSFVDSRGQKQGPFTNQQLAALYRGGVCPGDCEVYSVLDEAAVYTPEQALALPEPLTVQILNDMEQETPQREESDTSHRFDDVSDDEDYEAAEAATTTTAMPPQRHFEHASPAWGNMNNTLNDRPQAYYNDGVARGMNDDRSRMPTFNSNGYRGQFRGGGGGDGAAHGAAASVWQMVSEAVDAVQSADNDQIWTFEHPLEKSFEGPYSKVQLNELYRSENLPLDLMVYHEEGNVSMRLGSLLQIRS